MCFNSCEAVCFNSCEAVCVSTAVRLCVSTAEALCISTAFISISRSLDLFMMVTTVQLYLFLPQSVTMFEDK